MIGSWVGLEVKGWHGLRGRSRFFGVGLGWVSGGLGRRVG